VVCGEQVGHVSLGRGAVTGQDAITGEVWDDAVPPGAAAEEGSIGPQAADQDRDAWLLQRSRQQRDPVDGEVLAVVGDDFALPQPVDDLQRLVEAPADRGQVPCDAEPVVVRPAPQPCTEQHTPTREPIERRQVTGDLPGLASRDRCDPRPEKQRFGPGRDRGERDPRVGHRGCGRRVHVAAEFGRRREHQVIGEESSPPRHAAPSRP